MFKAKRFGIRIMSFALCVLLTVGIALPASATMAELELETTDRLAANIRYSASTNGTIIGCLEDGAELTVIGEKQNFYRIDCYGMKGYIAKEQVCTDENGFYYVNCSEESSLTRELRVCSAEETEALRAQVLSVSKSLLGIRYRTNGSTTKGFDCSGFVKYVYNKLGYSLNRTASDQMANGVAVDRNDLQPGDLVFFKNTYNSGRIASHVGIYIGDGKFIHCASRGVSIDYLSTYYYVNRFLCARRIILTGNAAYDSIPNAEYTTNRSSDQYGRSCFLSNYLYCCRNTTCYTCSC